VFGIEFTFLDMLVDVVDFDFLVADAEVVGDDRDGVIFFIVVIIALLLLLLLA